MKKQYLIFSLMIGLFLVQPPLTAHSQTGKSRFRFGFVKSNYEGAGDSIWLATSKEKDRTPSKSVLVLGIYGSGRINIDGNDLEIKQIKEYLPDKNFKVGRGGYEIWKGKNIRLRIDYIFTWLCSPKDEQCEVYHYKGVMDITYKGKRRKVKIIGFGGT